MGIEVMVFWGEGCWDHCDGLLHRDERETRHDVCVGTVYKTYRYSIKGTVILQKNSPNKFSAVHTPDKNSTIHTRTKT